MADSGVDKRLSEADAIGDAIGLAIVESFKGDEGISSIASIRFRTGVGTNIVFYSGR